MAWRIGELSRCDLFINAKEWINILKKGLPPTTDTSFPSVNRADISFQHDNAPHSAEENKIGFENPLKMMFWPW